MAELPTKDLQFNTTLDTILEQEYETSLQPQDSLQLYNSWLRTARAYDNVMKQLLKLPESVWVAEQAGLVDAAIKHTRAEVNKLAYQARKARKASPNQ